MIQICIEGLDEICMELIKDQFVQGKEPRITTFGLYQFRAKFVLIHLLFWLTHFFSMSPFNTLWNHKENLKIFWWFQKVLKENIGKAWANSPWGVFHEVHAKPNAGFLDHPISLRAHVLFFGCPSPLTSTLRNFATFFALDFLQLLDALGKRWKYDIILQQGFKKLLNGLLDSPFLRGYYRIHFSFLQYKFLPRWLLYLK